MSNLLTVLTVQDGKITRASLEWLSRCNELAEQHQPPSCALVITDDSSGIADQLSDSGVDTLYTIEHPLFRNPLNAPLITALSEVTEEIHPRMVAFASSESTKDVLGAVAARDDRQSVV